MRNRWTRLQRVLEEHTRGRAAGSDQLAAGPVDAERAQLPAAGLAGLAEAFGQHGGAAGGVGSGAPPVKPEHGAELFDPRALEMADVDDPALLHELFRKDALLRADAARHIAS